MDWVYGSYEQMLFAVDGIFVLSLLLFKNIQMNKLYRVREEEEEEDRRRQKETEGGRIRYT